MNQISSPSFSSQMSPNIRNFKELYHIKYQEKHLQNMHGSQLHPQVQPQTSQINPQQKDVILHGSSLLGPQSPQSSIKFPAFSAQQKQKLFLNNTNIIPKKVQQKAKMVSLNLQNVSQNQNQNQSARNAEPTTATMTSTLQRQEASTTGLPYSQSTNLIRSSQSYQSPVAGAASPIHIPNSTFLSKQNSIQQLNPPNSQLYSGNRHRGSAGSYSSLFSNANITAHNTNINSNSSSNNSSSNNNNEKEQKRFEQFQLLEKYKGTPFLNYMFLNQSKSPVHSPSHSGFLKEINSAYASSAVHSRNPSSTLFQQQSSIQQQHLHQQQQQQIQQNLLQSQQLQLSQQFERKQSSHIENRSQIVGASPANLPGASHFSGLSGHLENTKLENSLSARWSHSSMTKNSFNYQYVIGKGGFGKVWRVEFKKNKQPFAMKEMSKSKIITKRSVNSVMSERHLLSQLKHPFLVNMNQAFQDRDNLYLVMDLVSGGDLRFHIGRHRKFKEAQTKFFIACIIVALEYLHSKNVIHRDIKPENLVLDTEGYVKVTDLGVARIWKPDNSQDTSGTPGYMAPEVMCRQNHGIAVDYFAVGVIAYEFMMGRRPYLGRNRKEIRDQILSKQVQIKKHEIPEGWSIEAADFINRMIQRKPVNRLGVNGPEEVKQHPWIKTFPWDKLLNRQLDAPFIPQAIEDNYEYRQQISADGEDTNEELIQQNAILLRKNSVQNLFAGYNYDGNEPNRQQNLSQSQINLQSASSPINNQTGSTSSTLTSNFPSDRSHSALHARKTPTQFA